MKYICEKCGQSFDKSGPCLRHEDLCGLNEDDLIRVRYITVSLYDFSITEGEDMHRKEYAISHLDLGCVIQQAAISLVINYDEPRVSRNEAFKRLLCWLEREYKKALTVHQKRIANYRMIKKLATQNTEESK